MATKSEIFPITLQVKPDPSLNLDLDRIKINLEKSNIEIFNDRGGRITDDNPTTGDKSKLFVDNDHLLIGYMWDTGKMNDIDSRFGTQDYYLFTFLVAIDYDTTGSGNTKTFVLSYSTKKLLEASSVITTL